MPVNPIRLVVNPPPQLKYFTGDIVAGAVKFDEPPSSDLKNGITITIFGSASVEWTDESSKTRITYYGSQTIFETSQKHSIIKDQPTYPFNIQIPNIPALPWSLEAKFGKVEYGVKTVIEQLCTTSGKLKRFTAIVPISLNPHLNPTVAQTTTRTKAYCKIAQTTTFHDIKAGFCCYPLCCWYYWSKESIRFGVRLKSMWAYPGEDVFFKLELDNTSGRHVGDVIIQLVGIWTYEAQHSTASITINTKKTDEIILQKGTLALKVPAREIKFQNGKFKLPSNLLPTQVESDVIRLTYKLRFIVEDISGYDCLKLPVTFEVDLVVGTQRET